MKTNWLELALAAAAAKKGKMGGQKSSAISVGHSETAYIYVGDNGAIGANTSNADVVVQAGGIVAVRIAESGLSERGYLCARCHKIARVNSDTICTFCMQELA